MDYILKRYYYISSSGQCHRVWNRHKRPLTALEDDTKRDAQQSSHSSSFFATIVLPTPTLVSSTEHSSRPAAVPTIFGSTFFIDKTLSNTAAWSLFHQIGQTLRSVSQNGDDKVLQQFPCYLVMDIDICRVFIRYTRKQNLVLQETTRRPRYHAFQHHISHPARGMRLYLCDENSLCAFITTAYG